MDNTLKWIFIVVVLGIIGVASYLMMWSAGDLQNTQADRLDPTVTDSTEITGRMVDTTDSVERDSIGEYAGDTTGNQKTKEKRDSTKGENKVTDNDSSEKRIGPPPPGDQIAPGRAEVRFEVEQVRKVEGRTILAVNVLEVVGYGSATPALATGSTLAVNASGYLSGSDRKVGNIESEETYEALLEYNQQPVGGRTDSNPSWSLIKIF